MIALCTGGLDLSEQRPNNVHHRKQDVGALCVELQLAIADSGQKVLPGVSHRLELVECQEATSAFDRVDGAKDTRDQIAITRLTLKCNQVTIQLIQVLMGFHEEFRDYLINFKHKGLLLAMKPLSAAQSLALGRLSGRFIRGTTTVERRSYGAGAQLRVEQCAPAACADVREPKRSGDSH